MGPNWAPIPNLSLGPFWVPFGVPVLDPIWIPFRVPFGDADPFKLHSSPAVCVLNVTNLYLLCLLAATGPGGIRGLAGTQNGPRNKGSSMEPKMGPEKRDPNRIQIGTPNGTQKGLSLRLGPFWVPFGVPIWLFWVPCWAYVGSHVAHVGFFVSPARRNCSFQCRFPTCNTLASSPKITLPRHHVSKHVAPGTTC